MLTLHTKTGAPAEIYGRLVLRYEQREKCRLRARLDSGEEVAIFTVRGSVLRGGDFLTGADGKVVQVLAAPEPTYLVRCTGARVLALCAYHLGNRHTQVQIGPSTLRILADPVLREMVEGLGAQVDEELTAFEPESGAYAGGGHHHRDETHPLAPVALRQRIHRPDGAA